MKLEKFHKIIDNTPADVREDIKLSMDILERIHELLEKKFDGKQKLLAEKLNKSEAEISKWFSGLQNFTTKTIAKLQVAFGEPIIAVCTEEDHSIFIQVKLSYNSTFKTMLVNKTGNLEEQETRFTRANRANSTNIHKQTFPQ
jgi:hypothetical protein